MSNYRYMASQHDKLPNAENTYYVGWESLPLTCPMPEMSLWNSHPHVYVPLHETDEATCIYCGAKYILKEITLGEEMPVFANMEIEWQYHRRVDQLRRQQEKLNNNQA